MANLIYDYYFNKNELENSDFENKILKALKNPLDLDSLLKNDKDYELQFHFNPQRHNILNVCDIKKEDKCLEIGASYGAISEAILKYTEHLDSIEESKNKSIINEIRNNKHEDFNIYVGKLTDIKLEKRYDKIFIIGSLENAKLYFPNSLNPYLDLLLKIKSYLNEKGKIFIALNNKYGFKYFSGSKDDNSNTYFKNIEGNNETKLFSYNEIKELLNKASLTKQYFYYPLPDFKFPVEIYSEDYLPKNIKINYLGHSYDTERYVFFDESKALLEASKNDDFKTFTNSFLIEVSE